MPRLAFVAVPIAGDVLEILGCCTPQTLLPLHRISGRSIVVARRTRGDCHRERRVCKVYVFCNHKITERVMCAVCECGVDTQRLSFPSTAVALRKAIALHRSQSAKNVCAGDPNYCGVETNAKVQREYWTSPVLSNTRRHRPSSFTMSSSHSTHFTPQQL